MSDLRIKRLHPENLDALYRLEKASFDEPWSRETFKNEFNNTLSRYFGVFYREKLIAYGGYWKVIDEGHITNIAVHPRYRRKGIGAALLKSLLIFGSGEGLYRFTLEVRKSNSDAINLYTKASFAICGERRNYYSNGEDAFIMWASLPRNEALKNGE
jgi:ribosomal-protein-alanine N-acetyltransferase